MHSLPCLQLSLLHIKKGNAYMSKAIHPRTLPADPNGQSWAETDSSSGRETKRGGGIVLPEHKYKHEMNTVEEPL